MLYFSESFGETLQVLARTMTKGWPQYRNQCPDNIAPCSVQWSASERKPCHHTQEHAGRNVDANTLGTPRHRKMSITSTRDSVLVWNKMDTLTP